MNSQQQQCIAMAGIFQAATLCAEIAQQGRCNEQALQASIASLLDLQVQDTLAVYGSLQHINLGLASLNQFCHRNLNHKDSQIPRYAIGLLMIERKLIKNKKIMQLIRDNVVRAKQQSQHFHLMHDNVLANLADTYVQSAGSLRFRIQVLGNAHYLQNKVLVNKIRATLLAGLRAAVLWRQTGGKLYHLLFLKRALQKQSDYWLTENAKNIA